MQKISFVAPNLKQKKRISFFPFISCFQKLVNLTKYSLGTKISCTRGQKIERRKWQVASLFRSINKVNLSSEDGSVHCNVYNNPTFLFNIPSPLSFSSLCCRFNVSLSSNICKANPRSLFLSPRISTNSLKCNCQLATVQQHFWHNYSFWGVSNQVWKLQKFQGGGGLTSTPWNGNSRGVGI